jgi:hypothetical protein
MVGGRRLKKGLEFLAFANHKPCHPEATRRSDNAVILSEAKDLRYIHLARSPVLVFNDAVVENPARAIKPETSPEVLRYAQDDRAGRAYEAT